MKSAGNGEDDWKPASAAALGRRAGRELRPASGYFQATIVLMSAGNASGSFYDFFGPRGRLAQVYPGYEYRRGQLEMAEAVAAALVERRHLILEAGTGTGKTLGYLVPIVRSGRRVLISTGTRNLQEQLVFKDIPWLERALDRKLNAVLVKGRGNYACRWKVQELEKQPALLELEELGWYGRIREWAGETAAGDRAELDFLPENARLWERLNARRETCAGQKCPLFEACFLTTLRQQAAQADLVVVNHHLFFADLTLKQRDLPGVLPPYEAVLFDEAHELEEIAGQYFGLGLSNFQIEDFCRDLAPALKQRDRWQEAASAASRLRLSAAQWMEALTEKEGRFRFQRRAEFLARHALAIRRSRRALAALDGLLQVAADPELRPLAQRCAELAIRLEFLLEHDEAGMVYWCERRGRGLYLQATPIDVGPYLRESLLATVDTVMLTSATLAVDRGFDYIRGRLGLETARECLVESPFDAARQALLYLPPELPDPRAPEFFAAAAAEVETLLAASRGRAFLLFTSHEQMRRFHRHLAPRLGFPCLLQGEAPRHLLLERYRQTPEAVLFATSSFWQGVDVQGEQLSCVIIDRLPFAAPGDPVTEARIEALRRQGRNPFAEFQVPSAVLALKQGFGRLLRSRRDRGVLALLDVRIRQAAYGRRFLESLPPYRLTQSLEEVRAFFAQSPATPAAAPVAPAAPVASL